MACMACLESLAMPMTAVTPGQVVALLLLVWLVRQMSMVPVSVPFIRYPKVYDSVTPSMDVFFYVVGWYGACWLTRWILCC